MTAPVRVLYLDIDGTVRWGKDELGKFVNTKDDVKVFSEVPELLRQYQARGWKIVGVSNQAGIGLGYMQQETCDEAMEETDRQTGNLFDFILYCPHKPEEHCHCRKPKAGLVIQAQRRLAEEMGTMPPLNAAVFVGDRPEDQECALNAGVRFVSAAAWRNGNHLAEMLWDEA